jgi:hypothetical protein
MSTPTQPLTPTPDLTTLEAHTLTLQPLLDLALESLYCRQYGYPSPSESDILKALTESGITNPILYMEAWRVEKGIRTEQEAADAHNALLPTPR